MKSLVVYDSIFGNTQHIARKLCDILAAKGNSVLVKAQEYAPEMIKGTKLMIIGSPTRVFKPTPDITKLIRSLDTFNFQNCSVAIFDTRIAMEDIPIKLLRSFQKRSGGAAGVMMNLFAQRDISLIAEPESFFVQESEGPLKEGELDRSVVWVQALLNSINGGNQ